MTKNISIFYSYHPILCPKLYNVVDSNRYTDNVAHSTMIISGQQLEKMSRVITAGNDSFLFELASPGSILFELRWPMNIDGTTKEGGVAQVLKLCLLKRCQKFQKCQVPPYQKSPIEKKGISVAIPMNLVTYFPSLFNLVKASTLFQLLVL